jgi:hypothetical protein
MSHGQRGDARIYAVCQRDAMAIVASSGLTGVVVDSRECVSGHYLCRLSDAPQSLKRRGFYRTLGYNTYVTLYGCVPSD